MSELIEWAEDRPLFNLNEAERSFGLEREYLREKLSRLVKSGELRRIERNKYTVHSDPIIYSSHIIPASFISLWSGLRFYDLTTQQPSKVQVLCPVNRDDTEKVEFHKTSEVFGFRRRSYRGFEVNVAEKERLMIDCVARRQVPVEELRDLTGDIDPDKLVKYAEMYGKKSVKKRIGYLMENFRSVVLEELKVEDSNYPSLDLSKPAEGEKNREWRLKINNDVIQKTA